MHDDAYPKDFDAELTELLRELSKGSDPHARRAAASPLWGARSTTPGLAKLERHLLAVHREELAWLLSAACRAALLASPRLKHHIDGQVDLTRRVQPVVRRRWNARCSGLLERAAEETDLDYAMRLVALAAGAPRFPGLRATRLSVAAADVLPSPETRLLHGVALAAENQPVEAHQVLGKLLGDGPNALQHSYAWEAIGHMRSRAGDLGAAAEAYRESAARGRPVPLLAAFEYALRAADAAGARACATALDAGIPEGDPILEQYVTDLLARQARCAGQLQAEALAGLSGARLGPVALGVVRALIG